MCLGHSKMTVRPRRRQEKGGWFKSDWANILACHPQSHVKYVQYRLFRYIPLSDHYVDILDH